MRALKFITGHVIYNPAYTYKFQLKTTLVAGGFSGSSGGPINDIELISGENNKACSRSIKPIFGRNFGTFNEGDALGMTGKFTKEAAIICGGKNKIENLNTCYEYNYTKNE